MNTTNRTTEVDLERAARGETIAGEAFRAMLRDPDALRQLRRLAAVRSLLEGEKPMPDVTALPDRDVDFAELGRYLNEGSLPDPARQAAVAELLAEYFPELPEAGSAAEADPASAETRLAAAEPQGDTEIVASDTETAVSGPDTKIDDSAAGEEDKQDDGSTKTDA